MGKKSETTKTAEKRKNKTICEKFMSSDVGYRSQVFVEFKNIVIINTSYFQLDKQSVICEGTSHSRHMNK